jgi:tetratricopeptide (TPR) repeat protein
MSTTRTIRQTALAGACLLAAACATGISGNADSISRWEKARTSDPRSATVQRSLGVAYFKANRYDDARAALTQAATLNAKDGVTALYLGLTAEAQNDLAGAQKAYESYLEVGKTRGAKNQIRDRLEALKLKRIQAEAKQALARESQLATVAGPRNTIAVMPFRFTGSDTTLRPIERGFAELITTDLSRVSALTVLERERIQALLDEIALQQTGTAEGTGVRAGKIIQAGRMVAGSIQQQGNTLQTDAFVTDVATTQLGAQTRDSRPLDDLFTMEKQIVLGLVQNMGITLTPAERNAIEQRPTRSLAAFLAFSRGLELSDRGQFDAAGRQFDNALRLDPSFGSAAQKSQEAKSAATGNSVSASSVESSLRGSSEGAAVNAATSTTTVSVGGGAGSIAEGLNPSTAGGATAGAGTTSTQPSVDASAGTGGDNPTTKTAKVSITIKKPGGTH